MSEECYSEIEDYKTAFECFKQRFLKDKKSIFRLDSNETILTPESIKYLVDNFVNNGYGGKDSSEIKFKHQLTIDPLHPVENETVKNNAIEVLAHCIWLWRLVPSNGKKKTTIDNIKEILEWIPYKNINLNDNPFFSAKIKGIAKTGTYYNTNKPFEIAYIINILKFRINEKKYTNDDFINYLIKTDGKGKVTIKGDYDLKYGIKIKDEKATEQGVTKSAAIFHALLHFFEPEKYEAIISNEHKKKIVEVFQDLVCKDEKNSFEPETDWNIYCIKENLGGEDFEGIYFFYQDNIRKLWDSDSIDVNKNIIYYGVPGTGKTYGVLEALKNQENIEYKFIQFHPSYGYEDFIEGIKPVKSKDRDIKLELVNGEFKKMCVDAFKELEKAKQEEKEPKKFYFIADEINRAELSRVFGELLVCIEEDKRLKLTEDNKVEGLLIKTQYSSMWEDKHIVVHINASNEIIEDGEGYFGVPENIYFIGTMNDVDRSIESFDLALRRRFIWIKKEINYKVIKDIFNEDYKKSCKSLNDEISKIVGKNYQLGHSYFLKVVPINKQIPNISKKILFDTELKPILVEYLKSVIDESAIDNNIEILENKFIKYDNDSNS